MFLPVYVCLCVCRDCYLPLHLLGFQEVRFTLDRCSSAIVMETEGVDSWAMTEDRSSCEVRGVTPNRDRYCPAQNPTPLTSHQSHLPASQGIADGQNSSSERH